MNRIKEVIKKKGVTQSQLAKYLHKTKSTVSMYANNKVQPNVTTLYEIAEILQVDPRDLLTGIKNK